MLAMLFSAVAGGYLGARGAGYLPPKVVRGCVIVLCAAVTVYFFRR
jgi:uncharacterized membrane protein YfcA